MSMKKVSVSEAAEFFGVSKEAIHNRIRRGSLEVAVVDGIKMVVINPAKVTKSVRKTVVSSKASSNDERYYKLLQEQNEKLQAKVDMLEGETRSLRDQKELMLIEERKKIEAIYKEKDEQLKNILSTLSSQFMLTQPVQEKSVPDESVETVEVLVAESQEASTLISLKKYLKSSDFSAKKRVKIKARCIKKALKDERIVMVGTKVYIDPYKYDYSDLVR